MLRHIACFEMRFWVRSWMLWIFLLCLAVATLLSAGAGSVTLGAGSSNTFRNAPLAIENRYALMCVIGLLITTAFVNSAALRDFNHNTYPLIFAAPIRRRAYLLGRFFGALVISLIPMLGVSIGILLAKGMPWSDPSQWGPVKWTGHLNGILLFAIPNTFFIACILFAVAVLARRDAISFIAALLLFMGFVTGDLVFRSIKFEHVAALLDPFGIRALALVTRYWTVAEKNNASIGLSGVLLWNRLIWIGVSCLIFAASYRRFSFADRRAHRPLTDIDDLPAPSPVSVMRRLPEVKDRRARPKSSQAFALAATLIRSARMHFFSSFKSNFAIVIAVALLIDLPLLVADATEGYGNQSFPVTYKVIDLIREDGFYFVLVVITYFAGVLVWRDRDDRINEITDATPVPEWISYASRLATLLAMVVVIQLAALVSGVAVQTFNGYHRFQLGLYFYELMIRDGSSFLFLTALAFFTQVLAPNRYLGYFAYVAFLVANSFVWRPLNVATYLVQFVKRPNVIYSDFFGDAPYRAAWTWYTIYWLAFSLLIAMATVMLWPRGKQSSGRSRIHDAAFRYGASWKAATAASLLVFAGCGAWIWYNTEVVNTLLGPKDRERLQADFEKTYKHFENLPEPHVRDVRYAIDIFPSSRQVNIRGDEEIYNPYPHPLEEVHFSVDPLYDTQIDIPGAEIFRDDPRLSYRIYHFSSPLQPGEERTLTFRLKSHSRGFENDVTNPRVVQNGTFVGTFFDSGVAPLIGYNYFRELRDAETRKKYGLAETGLMPALENNCTADCSEAYFPPHSADWVSASAVISTSADQIAIAPGSLVREWTQDRRRYFEYKLDHVSINSYAFFSAGYEAAREEWNGIQLEVYYLKEHPWNVPRMIESMKASLDYYIKNFGPYYHNEARLVEVPRVSGFAQEFPGTFAYSESLGFIANLNHPDDIDTVYYVVAHEMAHQWWDEQVVPANMAGATLLDETLAQYSSLMVMEKEYGRDMMRKFLRYEMDDYLRLRSQEKREERPLISVEYDQQYIHYHKGAIVLYYMKEMIGEDAVNRALRKLIGQYAYKSPPYPASYALVDALREQTPPSLQYLIKDLFEDITLFSNRTVAATAVKRFDDKYDVTINVEARKFKADGKGNETEVPVDDWIDIGALAKPASDKLYGDTLYRQRVHITQHNSTFTFTVSELPDTAGIDPFSLLIDRVPDDNMKTVTLESSPAGAGPK